MISTCFQTDPVYALPRPDRLLQQVRFRRQPASIPLPLLRDLLAQYGLEVQGAVQAVGGPGRSHNVVAGTNAGLKFIKRYKHTVDPSAITHEHSILQQLAQINFSAPRLLPTTHGTTLVEQDGKYYAVFEVLNGYFQYHHYLLLPSQTRQCIAAAGRALGELHTVLHDFTPAGHHPNGFRSRTGERWRDLQWYQAQLDQARAAAQAADATTALHYMLREHANTIEATLHDLDATLAAVALPRCIIHGDYGPYNLLFKRGAPVVVLDWELARLDWRLVDLATALFFFAHTRFGFSFGKAQWFVHAYCRACAVDEDELRWLPPVWQFITLRRVIVCWQRFAQTPDHRWLAEAHTKLALAQWISQHQQQLSSLGSVE